MNNQPQDVQRFTIDSCIRGYHVYKDIWNPVLGEVLTCRADIGNVHDPYAVVTLTAANTTVGHVPRNISTVCHLFLRRNGNITCEVTGRRRRSVDLPQGGLEVPCTLTFIGQSNEISKVKKLTSIAPVLPVTVEPPSKKPKVDVTPTARENSPSSIAVSRDATDIRDGDSCAIWLTFNGHFMTLLDQKILLEQRRLNDHHINFAQGLLHHQFPSVDGLGNTLLQRRPQTQKIKHGLQIIHDRDDHWIVVSTIGCSKNAVKVFDSFYTTIDEKTMEAIVNLFLLSDNPTLEMVKIQKQKGSNDCGPYAIAVATAILHDVNLTITPFCQEKIWSHLLLCFRAKSLELFPVN